MLESLLFLAINLSQGPEFRAAAEPPLQTTWSVGRIAIYVVAIGVIGLGIRMLWIGKTRAQDPTSSGTAPVRGLGRLANLTPPTLIVIGLALGLAGYHMAAWVSPPEWFALQIPRQRWWALLILAALGVGGSLLAERLERQ